MDLFDKILKNDGGNDRDLKMQIFLLIMSDKEKALIACLKSEIKTIIPIPHRVIFILNRKNPFRIK
jgi:hypothetical protein